MNGWLHLVVFSIDEHVHFGSSAGLEVNNQKIINKQLEK